VSDPEAVWRGLLWYSTNLSALLACCDLCVGKEKLLVCVCVCMCVRVVRIQEKGKGLDVFMVKHCI